MREHADELKRRGLTAEVVASSSFEFLDNLIRKLWRSHEIDLEIDDILRLVLRDTRRSGSGQLLLGQPLSHSVVVEDSEPNLLIALDYVKAKFGSHEMLLAHRRPPSLWIVGRRNDGRGYCLGVRQDESLGTLVPGTGCAWVAPVSVVGENEVYWSAGDPSFWKPPKSE